MAEDHENCQSNNAVIFRAAICNSLKNIAESVSEEAFVKAFTVLASNPGKARKLRKVFVDDLGKSMNETFEEMLAEGALVNELNMVQKLSEEATLPAGQNAWRPPGDVREHLRSLDAERMIEHTATLQKQVTALDVENETLVKEISERRAKVRALDERMTQAVKTGDAAILRLGEPIEQMKEYLTRLHRE